MPCVRERREGRGREGGIEGEIGVKGWNKSEISGERVGGDEGMCQRVLLGHDIIYRSVRPAM